MDGFELTREYLRRLDRALAWVESQPARDMTGRQGPIRRPEMISGWVLMRVKEVLDDYLKCRTWDGTSEGEVDVLVAKPLGLRKSDFDGKTIGGIAYVATGTQARTASSGGNSEDQVIRPPYVVDDPIFAVVGISGGTGVVVSGEAVMFQDTSNRRWESSCPTT